MPAMRKPALLLRPATVPAGGHGIGEASSPTTVDTSSSTAPGTGVAELSAHCETRDLLDDTQPLQSFVASPQPGEAET
jgi:hypothetical protein